MDTHKRGEAITRAEVVRRAVDDDTKRQTSDVETALSVTFGAAPDASVPSRGEWDRR